MVPCLLVAGQVLVVRWLTSPWSLHHPATACRNMYSYNSILMSRIILYEALRLINTYNEQEMTFSKKIYQNIMTSFPILIFHLPWNDLTNCLSV